MRGQLIEDRPPHPVTPRSTDKLAVKRGQRMLGLTIHPPGTPATEAFAEEHPLEAVPLSPAGLDVPVPWNSATADRRTA
jgi:hypothetical protein